MEEIKWKKNERQYLIKAKLTLTCEEVRDYLMDVEDISDDYIPTEKDYERVADMILQDMSDSYYKYFDSYTIEEESDRWMQQHGKN